MTKLIKPVKNTKKFFKDARILQGIMSRNVDGTLADLGETQELGAYTKEKFNGSKQILRGPVWSDSKRQYNVGDISDEELNELVEACSLYDDRGNLIKTANRYRYGDPFFEHLDLKMNLDEGEGDIEDSPVYKILMLGFKQRTQINTSTDSNPLISSRQKYKIVDKGVEVGNKNNEIDLWAEIGSLLKAMDEDKMKRIAISMKIGVGEETSHQLVKSTLGKALMSEDRPVKGGTETYRQMFLRLSKAPDEEINLNYYIATAIKKGYLRRRSNQGWLYNGKPVATVESQISKYFQDPHNQEEYFELERLIVGDTSKKSTSKTKSKTKQDSK